MRLQYYYYREHHSPPTGEHKCHKPTSTMKRAALPGNRKTSVRKNLTRNLKEPISLELTISCRSVSNSRFRLNKRSKNWIDYISTRQLENQNLTINNYIY